MDANTHKEKLQKILQCHGYTMSWDKKEDTVIKNTKRNVKEQSNR